jgi:hypothetical protein
VEGNGGGPHGRLADADLRHYAGIKVDRGGKRGQKAGA